MYPSSSKLFTEALYCSKSMLFIPEKNIIDPFVPFVLGKAAHAKQMILKTRKRAENAVDIELIMTHLSIAGARRARAPNIAVESGNTNAILVSAAWSHTNRRASSFLNTRLYSLYFVIPFAANVRVHWHTWSGAEIVSVFFHFY